MTGADWNSCTDPQKMLEFLRGKASDRQFRLFACACCRSIWHRLPDARSRRAVETAERFIEGEVPVGEMIAVRHEAEAAQRDARQHRRLDDGENAAIALASAPEWNPDSWPSVNSVATQASCAAAHFAELSGTNRKTRKLNWLRGYKEEKAVQCNLLRDIFGPLPFREVHIDSAWLAWNDGTMKKLAEAAYEQRSLPDGTLDQARLAVLADALEEAGCADTGLLAHLRSSGPHVRGCHVVDILLGKS
jgi:hypothetical protein